MANEFKIKNGLVVSGSAEIENNLTVRGRLTADEYHVSIVSSSVLYESGSTKFGDSLDDTHVMTGSLNITGSILLNGTTVGTGKLDETTFESFTSSYLEVSSSLDERVGDLESFSSSLDTSFVSETEFGDYSGSINTFTSSIDGRVSDLETESGSIRSDFNTFTSSYTNVSTSLDSRLDSLETLSGSFTGSFTGSFSGDGTNLYNIPASGVTGLNLTQIADGSVTASVSNANGLRVNSKTEITGSLIVTDGITGSIDYSNITNKPTLVSGSEQVDITGTTGYSTFSSSISSSIGELSSSVAATTNDLDGRLDNVETSTGSLNTFTSSINTTIKDKLDTEDVISGSVQVNLPDVTGFSEFSSSISSSVTTIFVDNLGQDNRLDAIETSTGSLNTFTSSINTTIKDKLNTEGVISGSVQVSLPDVTGYSTFSSSISSSIGVLSSSVATTDNTQNDRLSSLETASGSIREDFNTYTGSNDITNTTQDGRLQSLETKTGSYATTGSNIFVGAQTISGSVIIRENLTVLGSSSITYTTSSQLRVDDNVIVVNTASPAERFGGLQVYDSGSVGEATGSLFWDSQKNRWVYQQSSESTYGGGVLLSGPRSSGSLGDELTLTSGKIARSAGGDHLNDSIITEYGGVTIGISGGLEITGSIVSTGTPIVSGSEQISFNGITDKPSLVSGSSQIDLTAVTNYSSGIKTRLDAEGVVSGSSQITYSGLSGIPSGIVSGSSQVLTGTGIWSGSAQLPSGVVSGSSQVLAGTTIHSGSFFNGVTVVSGSGQISFNGITDKPTLVSGSSQITYGSLTGIPSGIVSGSSQVLAGTTIHSGSFFNGISVVSGSAQIDITATTNYSTYINQAVKSTSTPQFAGLYVAGNTILSNSTSPYTYYFQFGDNSGWIYRFVTNVSGTPTTRFSFKDNGDFTSVGAITGSNFSGTSSGTNTGDQTLSSLGAQAQLNGTGFVKASGTSISYDNSTYQTVGATHYIGTTSIANNRASASQTLTGVSIDGNAGTATILQTARTINGISFNGSGNISISKLFDAGGSGNYINYSSGNELESYDSSNNLIDLYLNYSGGASSLRGPSGNIVLHAGNYNSYAMAGAGYSANQNLNTSNSTTFAGLTVNGNVTLGSTNGHYTRINDTLYLGASDSGDSHFYFGEDSSSWYGSYWYWDSQFTHYWYSRHAGTNTVLMYHDTRETTNVYFQRHILPNSNNSYNLGSASLGWANVYTNDLHLSNMNKPEGNDIDGTSGTWTIQEGAENLYIINNRNGKKFKISLEEIL